MKSLTTYQQLRKEIDLRQCRGDKIALLPTMGALHKGHLSLVELARQKADLVIVSIFVNPTQFSESQDLEHYPRDEKRDLEKLSAVNADLVYIPDVDQIYPHGFATTISVHGVSQGLCGRSRAGHFDGVATVVTKLLLQYTPDIAIFGEKDYQQLLVIKRLVADLQLPVEIIGAAIVREKDGLALSSRNVRLSTSERQSAPILYRVLEETADLLRSGIEMRKALPIATEQLSRAGFKLDYLELRNAKSLVPMDRLTGTAARLLIAARLGRTRLIDNISIMG